MRILIYGIFVFSIFFYCCNGKNPEKGATDVTTELSEGDSNAVIESKTEVNPHYNPTLVTLKGYVKGGSGANVILDELDIGKINPLVSEIIDENGNFQFNVFVNEPGIFQLRFPNGNLHLFLRGGNVQVNTNISKIWDYEVIGSPESMHLKQMYTILNDENQKTAAVQDRVKELEKDKDRVRELLALVDSLPIYYSAIIKSKSERLIKFIESIDTSMIALLSAFYLDTDLNYDFIVGVLDKFSSIAPHSKFYTQLSTKMEKIIPVGPGKMAPNTVVDNPQGKSVLLSDYKNKPVLLYFWASYSQPSRKENLEIKTISAKYKNKGFVVFSISLDEQKDPWLAAIKEDNLDWVNTSNLLGWDDELSNIYKVDNIPYLILIDKTGRIVARGFRARELEKLLIPLL